MTVQSLDQVKPTRPDITKGYGISTSEKGLMSWEWVDEQMAKSRNYWISTTRPDGRPHVTPVWGLWLDGTLYFGGDPNAVRSRNLAHNPYMCVHLESGDDVVILEGVVEIASDSALLRRVGEAYGAKYAMPFDPNATPGGMYALKPQKALAWTEQDYPNTATRWKFE